MNTEYSGPSIQDLAREVVHALNWLPNSKYRGVIFDKTYDLIAALEKHPMVKHILQGPDAN